MQITPIVVAAIGAIGIVLGAFSQFLLNNWNEKRRIDLSTRTLHLEIFHFCDLVNDVARYSRADPRYSGIEYERFTKLQICELEAMRECARVLDGTAAIGLMNLQQALVIFDGRAEDFQEERKSNQDMLRNYVRDIAYPSLQIQSDILREGFLHTS